MVPNASFEVATDAEGPLADTWHFSNNFAHEIREASLRMSPVVLPHRDPTQKAIFYMDVWRRQCLPALNSAFHRLELAHGPANLITDAVVALSACRLSRTLPQRKLFKVSSVSGLCVRPDAGHETLSHEHYGAVMRKMAGWSHEDFDANPALGLAVLVLFCYLESSMGNFKAFRVHSEGVKRLIKAYPDWVVHQGTDLLAAWVEVEMQNWWRRVYFGTPDFHRNTSSLALPPQLEAVLDTANHRRAAILLIMCESHRLNNAAIVAGWDGYEDSSGSSRFTGSAVPQADPELITLFQEQSLKLDDWFAFLPVSELPEYWEDDGGSVAPTRCLSAVQPLHFKSHKAAMNFAYYVTARVMQCTGPLGSLVGDPRTDIDTIYGEVEAWILMLLRIASAIDWDQCIKLNVYTVGFTSLLLACALHSRNIEIGTWMQTWLEEHLKGNEYEEGNFPVFQILEALRLVNAERRDGRDVFALFQTVDDSGGSGKLGSYHSQLLVSLQVYGRCRTSGAKYTYRRTV